MKFLATIISGIVVGAFGVYIALLWKEEQLVFYLSPPARFGEIVYQNLRIVNEGWDPATGVIVAIAHPRIKTENANSNVNIRTENGSPHSLGQIERIRRGESVSISFSFSGVPIRPEQVEIKSDRSVALYAEESAWQFDWYSALIGAGILFSVFAFLGVLVGAYRDYTKRAAQAESRIKTQTTLKSSTR